MATEEEKRKEQALSSMENYVKNWKIFMDTCSILDAPMEFWRNIIPYLWKYHKKIIIPLRCVEELQKHAKNTGKPKLQETAVHRLKLLQQMLDLNYVEIRGESTDNFADNVFQVVFTKFRLSYKMLLITQDRNLAHDILGLNDMKSVNGKSIHVRRVTRPGFLGNFHWDDEKKMPEKKSSGRELPDSPSNKNAEAPDPDEVFRVMHRVTQIPNTPLPVSHIPGEQEVVYTTSGPVKLTGKIASGGEGTIYHTNTPYVAKIYKKEKITKRLYEKIKRMLDKGLEFDGICYPSAAVYNRQKEFVGYLMPAAKGVEIQKSLFIKPLLLKTFPQWKKRDTVELCITILEKFKYLHDRHVIVGDINPRNILVVSPKEVYFVDTDSYQVEDFPCPVGTINYTAPEIQGKQYATFLRSMGHENFAIATLLFMIMLPGKPPYSQQGGADPVSNVLRMDFSYPFGENSNKKTPDGPWRYIWSHLPYSLKKAFYHTFQKDGDYSAEKNRLSVDDWLPMFTYYLELLDSGKFAEQDEMSLELYPTRHKKNAKFTYVKCRLCGKEVPENMCQNDICRDCLNQGETYHCKRCGKEILFTNYQKYIKNAKRFEYCQECFEYENRVCFRQTCVSCGRVFEITNSQYEYYMSKGYEIPKRCKSCRSAARYTSTPQTNFP